MRALSWIIKGLWLFEMQNQGVLDPKHSNKSICKWEEEGGKEHEREAGTCHHMPAPPPGMIRAWALKSCPWHGFKNRAISIDPHSAQALSPLMQIYLHQLQFSDLLYLMPCIYLFATSYQLIWIWEMFIESDGCNFILAQRGGKGKNGSQSSGGCNGKGLTEVHATCSEQ